MSIHKEGINTLLLVLVLLIIINAVVFYFYPDIAVLKVTVIFFSLPVFFFFLYFFRYPNRTIVYDEKVVLSPADGKVVVIEEIVEENYFNEKRIQVSIFMSPLNVHANWYPINGKIMTSKYLKGKYLVAWHPKASSDNERTEIEIEMANGIGILVKQIAGAVARRIVYYPRKGDIVKQGAELGFIKFGSRVDLILPLSANINVELNEKVKGGISQIATFD